MESYVCSIVPPHLLDALAVSEDPETRQMALETLRQSSHVRTRWKHHFDAKRVAHGHSGQHPVLQGIVPDQILEHVASSDHADGHNSELSRKALYIKQKLQASLFTSSDAANLISNPQRRRQIYDMENVVKLDYGDDVTLKLLPGKLLRSEGDAPVLDEQANQAYDNCATVVEFYQQVFDYTFLDDNTAPIISSIHFGKGYQNAQWVGGSLRQMIYGDGGRDLYNFTACLDIISHEMTVSPPYRQ